MNYSEAGVLSEPLSFLLLFSFAKTGRYVAVAALVLSSVQ